MRCLFIFSFLVLFTLPAFSTGSPSDIFNYKKALRLDFVLTGDHKEQQATISEIMEVPVYGNDSSQNIPPFDYGNYRILVLSPDQRDTLFIKGFCTLFEEWQSTKEAQNRRRAFKQTVEMPFPKNEIDLVLQYRKKTGGFITLLKETFKPRENNITRLVPAKHPWKLLHGTDDPSLKTDILILAEGYTGDEQEQFYADAQKATDYLINMPPYNDMKEHITVRALAIPSEESGTDDPNKNVWKNTALKSSFNTFGTDRYLESLHTWNIFDHAAALPRDHIVILVNTNKYGGGGVYNHFSIASAQNRSSFRVFLHEIGHGLAGLGDEYFSTEVAYNDFFDKKTEPWHPNITTLVDFDRKWKHFISDSVPIPTPANKEYEKVTGVFEGAGYSAKDIYRPAVDCRMRTNEADGFCEVCRQAIRKMIKFYSQQSIDR